MARTEDKSMSGEAAGHETRAGVAAGLVLASLTLAFGIGLAHLLTSRILPASAAYLGTILCLLLLMWGLACSAVAAGGRRGLMAWTWGLAVAATLAGLLTGRSAIIGAGLLLAGVGMLALALLAIGLTALLKRGWHPMLMAVPFALIAAAPATIVAGGVGPWREPPIPREPLRPDDEIAYLYRTDQQDRRTGLILLDSSRDQARLTRVEQMDRAGEITRSMPQYQAAVIYQHGRCPGHFRRAFELAATAARIGVPGAAGLAAAAEDRWLLSQGREQRHGTQILVSGVEEC